MKTITKLTHFFEKNDEKIIKQYAKDNHLTMTQLMEKLKISRTYFYDILKGKDGFTSEMFKRFVDLGIF